MAKELAENEYDKFHHNRLQLEAQQAENFEYLAKKVDSDGRERKQ